METVKRKVFNGQFHRWALTIYMAKHPDRLPFMCGTMLWDENLRMNITGSITERSAYLPNMALTEKSTGSQNRHSVVPLNHGHPHIAMIVMVVRRQ